MLELSLTNSTAYLAAAPFSYENTLLRHDQLIKTIKQNLSNENLQVVMNSTARYDNLLILENNKVFIGKRQRIRDWGFAQTTLIYDPPIIREEVDSFDTSFEDSVGFILGIDNPTPKVFGSKKLKIKVIQFLEESQEAIERRRCT